MAFGFFKKIGKGLSNAWNKTKNAIASGAKFMYNEVAKPLVTQALNNAGTIGTAVGAYFGGPAGAKLGNTLGNMVWNLTQSLNS